MRLETRDVLTFMAILISAVSMILVSRNARRATSVQAQNVDLARIRDLRSEVSDLKSDLDRAQQQVTRLARALDEANDAAMTLGRDRAEMLRFARMPGMDLELWLKRFDNRPPQLNGIIDA